MTPAERIERIVTGVIRQAMSDTGATHVTVCGSGADAELLRGWCARAFGTNGVGATGLGLHPANKTALLLGVVPQAAVLPLGDLFHTQVVELAGPVELPPEIAALADACGGAAQLDAVLEAFYDQRMSWADASRALPAAARDELHDALGKARFRRMRVALIPKLGARTLGIDLYA